jgi:hypothetical protein
MRDDRRIVVVDTNDGRKASSGWANVFGPLIGAVMLLAFADHYLTEAWHWIVKYWIQ